MDRANVLAGFGTPLFARHCETKSVVAKSRDTAFNCNSRQVCTRGGCLAPLGLIAADHLDDSPRIDEGSDIRPARLSASPPETLKYRRGHMDHDVDQVVQADSEANAIGLVFVRAWLFHLVAQLRRP